MRKTIRFIDMFAGIGGFREGFGRAGGFECVGSLHGVADGIHALSLLLCSTRFCTGEQCFGVCLDERGKFGGGVSIHPGKCRIYF